MAKQQGFVPPTERTDDLTVWENENDVAAVLRDLPASYGIMATDLGLEQGTEKLVRQLKDPENATARQEAKRKLSALQLIVLNLMLRNSGYRGQIVDVPVKEWDLRMLVAGHDERGGFGNPHMQSRLSDDSRYADPISPGEGWWYRMIDFQDNFFTVLKALRYYQPKQAHGDAFERTRSKETTKWALRMIGALLRKEAPEAIQQQPVQQQ